MVFDAYGTKFDIDERYTFVKALGKGAYGVVCSTRDSQTGNKVAIKKICPMAKSVYDAKHTLREIRLLRHCGQHPNIITLVDLMLGETEDSLYIGMECMDTDLHRIIQSSQKLSVSHHKHFMYQLVLGIDFLHSKGILHRDLKPANLLVSKNCDLRISDFGLARRAPEATESKPLMTEHVVTRWYRPPELMLSPDGKYTAAVDVWSVGCIFAELLGRTPLFPGKNFVHQLQLIFDVIGTPHPSETAYIKNSQAIQFLRSLPKKGPVDLASIYPHACHDAIDFMTSCIRFSASSRITVKEALAHPFFDNAPLKGKTIHVPEIDEDRFNFEFEQQELDEKALREIIIDEVADFVQEHGLRAPPKRDHLHSRTPVTLDTEKLRAATAHKQQHQHQQASGSHSGSSDPSTEVSTASRRTMSARAAPNPPQQQEAGQNINSYTNVSTQSGRAMPRRQNTGEGERAHVHQQQYIPHVEDDAVSRPHSAQEMRAAARDYHHMDMDVEETLSRSMPASRKSRTNQSYSSTTGREAQVSNQYAHEIDDSYRGHSSSSNSQQSEQGDQRLRKKSRSFTSRILSTSNKLSKSVTGHDMSRLPSVHRTYSMSGLSRSRSQPMDEPSSPMSCSEDEYDEFDGRRRRMVQEESKEDIPSSSSSSSSSSMLPIRNILRKQRTNSGNGDLPLREINRTSAYNSSSMGQTEMYKTSRGYTSKTSSTGLPAKHLTSSSSYGIQTRARKMQGSGMPVSTLQPSGSVSSMASSSSSSSSSSTSISTAAHPTRSRSTRMVQ